jgi:MoxR-like ATPase
MAEKNKDSCSISLKALSPEEFALIHGDDDSILLTLRADRDTRNFMVKVAKGGKMVLTNVATTADAEYDHEFEDEVIAQNWRIEGDKFVVWHPESGHEIILPVVDRGPLTPRDVPEILGQQQLLYNVAMSIAEGEHCTLVGPTGTGKTSLVRWLAQVLGYNYVLMPITRDTSAADMIGDYQPGEEAALFPWTDGPVAQATRLSQTHPTILCFDEANRIGNVAHFTKLYSVLDDTRTLVIPEKRSKQGDVLAAGEQVPAGNLFVFATANPVDYEDTDVGVADYIGVQELDPAFQSRFFFHPPVKYPSKDVEAAALLQRVPSLSVSQAALIVDATNRVRNAAEVRFPMSFREMQAWGAALKYHTYGEAAEVAVIQKAPAMYRQDLRRMLALQGESD